MEANHLIGVITFVDPEESVEDQQNTVGCTEVHESQELVLEEASRIAEEYLRERFGRGWLLSLEIGEHVVKLDIAHPGQTQPNLFLQTRRATLEDGLIKFVE